jgi:acid phosphatase
VIEENHSHQMIIGAREAPYINSLAAQGASFTDYHAVTRPSQPNYMAMFSGSTQGIIDNLPHWSRITAPSLGGQLIAAGLDFGGYSEDLPYTGFAWASYRNYHRRHNPWVNFSDVPNTDNLPFRNFPGPSYFARLPTVSFVVPNVVNDMHDGTVEQADDWLRAKLDPYVQWAKTHNSLFVLTWDEDDDDDGDSNRIPTIVVGAGVRPGDYSTPYTHYSLLRTIEDMYALPPLGEAANAKPFTEIWVPPMELARPPAGAAPRPAMRPLPRSAGVTLATAALYEVRATDAVPGSTVFLGLHNPVRRSRSLRPSIATLSE